MPGWGAIRLPSFENDLERCQIDEEKLQRWIDDILKSPKTFKGAHGLRGPWKHYWGAHFNPGETTFTVIYLVCEGKQDLCFKNRMEVDKKYLELIKHSCKKDYPMIFLAKIGPHQKGYKF